MAHNGSGPSATSAWRADVLARTTREAVWIGQLMDGYVHIVHQAAYDGDLVQVLGGDTVLPWYACALGHAIVAGLDSQAQETLLARPAARLTGLTVTEPEELRQLLAATRQRGYAVEAHMTTLGDAGIAAAVCDGSGSPIGAIGIVGPAERLLPPERLQGLAEAVCLAAEALTNEATAPDTSTPAGSP